MRQLPQRHVCASQRRHLARISARRRKFRAERRILAADSYRDARQKGTQRSKFRDDYLEQVRLDREAGLEWRRNSVEAYRKFCRQHG
jgi:hypothetical protein